MWCSSSESMLNCVDIDIYMNTKAMCVDWHDRLAALKATGWLDRMFEFHIRLLNLKLLCFQLDFNERQRSIYVQLFSRKYWLFFHFVKCFSFVQKKMSNKVFFYICWIVFATKSAYLIWWVRSETPKKKKCFSTARLLILRDEHELLTNFC